MDSKSVRIFFLLSVVAELLVILLFLIESKLENISRTHAATWCKKLATESVLKGTARFKKM